MIQTTESSLAHPVDTAVTVGVCAAIVVIGGVLRIRRKIPKPKKIFRRKSKKKRW